MSLLLTEVPDLPAELSSLLRQIPAGRVTTYGELARALGDVAAARWIGEYLLDHPHDETCPCHRVVRKGGEIGLYITGDSAEKAARLQSEGIGIDGSRVELDEPLFTELRSGRPLQRLRQEQLRLPEAVDLSPLRGRVRTVAGVDVSYVHPTLGAAAYVCIDVATHEVLWSTTVSGPVRFPYIAGYLTFRELPLHVALFEEVRRNGHEADLTLVDGNGILHPRRAGSASACGVAVETPTIGIGKKLLCGRVDLEGLAPRQRRDVVHEGEPIGVALKSGPRNRPFFASPGHRINLTGTVDVALRTLASGRLPVPITLADQLSREEAKRLKTSAAVS